MSDKKKIRNSSLELLRVICILLIIVHHYSVHGGFLPLSVDSLSTGRIFVRMIGLFGRISNSIFVLISGYFLVEATTKKHYRKIVPLMMEMLFYSIIIYGIMNVISPTPLLKSGGVKKLIEVFFPFFWGNWFVVYYILLYILSPFINVGLKAMSRKKYTAFVIVLLVSWSLMGTVTSAYNFNQIDFFLVMYILGGYIRLHLQEMLTYKNRWNLVVGLSAALITLLSVPTLCLGSFITNNNFFINLISKFSLANNIINITCSVFIFLYFANITFTSKLINEVSASVLGIYLIHDNDYVRLFLWRSISPNAKYVYFPYIHIVIKVIGVFVICFCIDYIRRKTVGAWFEQWFYKNCDGMVAWIKRELLLRKKG